MGIHVMLTCCTYMTSMQPSILKNMIEQTNIIDDGCSVHCVSVIIIIVQCEVHYHNWVGVPEHCTATHIN